MAQRAPPPVASPVGNMMMVPGSAGAIAEAISCAPHVQGSPTNASFNGHASQPHQSPFPMPLSPPHDLAHNMCLMNQQQQQHVFFEKFAPDGQQVNASAGC